MRLLLVRPFSRAINLFRRQRPILIQQCRAGKFSITATSATFAPQNFTGTLRSGEFLNIPQMVLAVATATTDVQVTEFAGRSGGRSD